MELLNKGIFITIEGPDGAGKSTQIDHLREFFDGKGMATLFTREPGGTDISEKLRDIILDKDNSEMSPRTEALLYAASRAQLIDEVIRPALSEGKVVICDRFVDSSLAYQGHARGLGDPVWDINVFAIDGVMPDVTLLLDLDPEIGRNRLDQNGLDRIESEDLTFHKLVYEGYKKLAEKYPERIKSIDASRAREEISADIDDIMSEILRKRGI